MRKRIQPEGSRVVGSTTYIPTSSRLNTKIGNRMKTIIEQTKERRHGEK